MHNIGLIIWLIIVAFGVISSIRKNVQRAQAQRAAAAPSPLQQRQPQPPQQRQPQPPQQQQPAPAQRSVTAAFTMPPVDTPPPPRPVAPPKPRPPVPQAPLSLTPEHPRIGTSPIRGMFGGSATLVRAIVAAEVLGQPKAFQEQTIWSPRHSEPSI
jgi:hypothetical protein